MISKEIEKVIDNANDGHLFIINDFIEYGNYDTIKKTIQRIVNKGKLHIITNGIYMKPQFSKLTNSYISCSPYELAECIARKYGWDIIPTGEIALNYFRLSTQVPAVYIYSSSGPYRTYVVNYSNIFFKHTSSKKLFNMPKMVQYLIQAINYYGKDRFDDDSKRILSKYVDYNTIIESLEYAKTVDKWIYDLIKEIKVIKDNEKDNKFEAGIIKGSN